MTTNLVPIYRKAIRYSWYTADIRYRYEFMTLYVNEINNFN